MRGENRLRPADLGSLSICAIGLIFIVSTLFCSFQRYVSNIAEKRKERTMKSKIIRALATAASDFIFVLQAVYIELLAARLA